MSKVILDLGYYSVFGMNLLCMEKQINMQSVSDSGLIVFCSFMMEGLLWKTLRNNATMNELYFSSFLLNKNQNIASEE